MSYVLIAQIIRGAERSRTIFRILDHVVVIAECRESDPATGLWLEALPFPSVELVSADHFVELGDQVRSQVHFIHEVLSTKTMRQSFGISGILRGDRQDFPS
jgi:hypothetical protein